MRSITFNLLYDDKSQNQKSIIPNTEIDDRSIIPK